MGLKRPLCLAALVTAAAIALWMQVKPPSENAFLKESGRVLTEGERVSAVGIVNLYEYRETTWSKTAGTVISKELWIYLKKIKIKEEQYSDNLVCRLELSGKEKPMRLKAGSLVQIEGNFSYFSQADNPGEFDANKYYKTLGIGGMLKQAQIVAVSSGYSIWKETLLRRRAYFKENIYRRIPPKEASVLAAMLLGEKAGIDSDTKALYQRNGIAHILSISGLHISILGILFYKILRKVGCPVFMAALAGACLLVSYGVMTGMGISAVRAIGMYLIRMLGECLGRSYDMLTALSLMGILMLLRHPDYLYYSGFLLSFGAVMGAGMVLPVLSCAQNGYTEIEKEGERVRKRRKAERKEKRESKYKKRKEEGKAKREPGGNAEAIWMKLKEDPFLKKAMKMGKEKQRKRKSLYRKGIEGLQAGMAILAVTLPVQLYYYYELPLYAQLLNLFVIPAMSFVMGLGLLVMAFPGIPFLGRAESLLLGSYELLCNFTERLPGHQLIIGRPAGWQIVGYYVFLFCWFLLKQQTKKEEEIHGKEQEGERINEPGKNRKIEQNTEQERHLKFWMEKWREEKKEQGKFAGRKRINKRRRKLLAGTAVFCAIFLLLGKFPQNTRITFLDVGQGDCIVVSTKAGEHYLFDGGSTTKKEVGSRILIPYLKYRGISRLSGVIISHPDKDHISGILELLEEGREEGISVDCVVLPGISPERRNIELGKILNAAEGITVKYLSKGDSFQSGKVEIGCLHPEKNSTLQDSNAYSGCFLITEGDFSLLLTGDVEGEGEIELKEELNSRGIHSLSVLKTAHHGSRFSTTEAFLEDIRPGIAVISCGRENSYGHPAPETLKRLTDKGWQLFSTMEGGALTMITDGRNLKVECFRGE